MKEYQFAEFVTGGIQNRNRIYNINQFNLNGVRTDCYRSLFLYDQDFKIYVEKTGSVKGFAGKHISDALIFDFDGQDLDKVKKETYNFAMYLYHTFNIPFEYLRIAFSGAKGFHVIIPMQAVTENPQPKDNFYEIYKKIAEDLAKDFKYVDFSIYEPKRIFRMNNTINSKTGLYKIPLVYDELDLMSIEEIKELAKKPRTVDMLPASEITLINSLNELYEKWNAHNFESVEDTHQKNKRSEILSLIENGASEGNRHLALIKLAGIFEENNFDYEFTLSMLKLWNNSNDPPLSFDRLETESKRAFEDLRKKRKNDISEIKIYSLREAEKEYLKYVSQVNNCKVRTGYEAIDKKIRGIMPGETMCILGKTSVGKSAFLQNIGINFIKESNEPVLFFSLEMPVTSVYERAMQIETGLTGYEIENQYSDRNEEIRIKANLLLSSLSNFYVITKTGLTLESINNLIRFAEDNIYHKKTGLVLIDYLSLVKGNGKDLYEQTSRVARGMKDLSKELNVPIIFLSQVTKAKTEYDQLEINSARDSGSVDEASDFVLGLWKQKDKGQEAEQPDIKLNLAILKNRKGGLGKVSVSMSKRSLKVIESELNKSVKNYYETEEDII